MLINSAVVINIRKITKLNICQAVQRLYRICARSEHSKNNSWFKQISYNGGKTCLTIQQQWCITIFGIWAVWLHMHISKQA